VSTSPNPFQTPLILTHYETPYVNYFLLLFFFFQAQPVEKILPAYEAIQLALVNGDMPAVTEKAGLLAKALNAIALPGNTANAALTNAKKIGASNDLAVQRAYFAALSLDIFTLLKTVRLSTQPIYRAYCPMKNAYWLTSTRTINNPYYDKAMLTCGTITDTIQPK
jgi:hypothetical protein